MSGNHEDSAEMKAAPKLRPRPSRSRCFKVFKFTILFGIVAMITAAFASVPWCIELARDLLKDLNSTTMAQMYSGQEPMEVTNSMLYVVVGISLMICVLYLLFGIIAIYKESVCLCLIFGISLLLWFAASICCYHHLLFLINMIVDLVMGGLVLIFTVAIRRADKCAPETLDELDKTEGGRADPSSIGASSGQDDDEKV